MKAEYRITTTLYRELQDGKYRVDDILQDISGGQDPMKALSYWTDLSNERIKKGLYNPNITLLQNAIESRLSPWLESPTIDGVSLPENITAIELAREIGKFVDTSSRNKIKERESGLPMKKASVEEVIRLINNYDLRFNFNGSTFKIAVENASNVSPKRAIRKARYKSRPPGGGPAQKVGLKQKDVKGKRNAMARERARIVFIQDQKLPDAESSDWTIDYGVMKELETKQAKSETKLETKTPEEIIYSEPKGAEIMSVFQWFKEVGFGKNWVYKGKEALFAENLVRLSKGEPVDFNIWNCIGFEWFEDPQGNMPWCNITNNLDAAISLYFKQRIRQLTEKLSLIGDPQVTILIPSNEAFDDRIWRYQQPYEEREGIINATVKGLTKKFNNVPFPPNATFKVMRWDEYLKSRGVSRKPQEYSEEGEKRVRQAENYDRIMQEAVKSGKAYFAQNGVTNIKEGVFANRQLMYYGVYAGEGVVWEELQQEDKGIVIVNFEEMRVPQMAYLGAQSNLSIVTPVKLREMLDYYQWEEKQIQKRK